jgi:hypothetical protein
MQPGAKVLPSMVDMKTLAPLNPPPAEAAPAEGAAPAAAEPKAAP